ncbi:MAG: DUF4279 domain-containing protein [Rhodobacterales bacterium]|nr:DUF4279 domain-containing protein [Rhodobacterales bacterium]
MTYWGCEVSTPKLSVHELSDLIGYDDTGVQFIGGFGRLRKLSCRKYMGRDHEAHFDVLLGQLPAIDHMRALKAQYGLRLEFYRFWLHAEGMPPPRPSERILSTIRDFGGEFEDVPAVHRGDHRMTQSGISFIVRGRTMDFAAIGDAIGEPTRILRPTDRVRRSKRRNRQENQPHNVVSNLTTNRAVWMIESHELTPSEDWDTVLETLFRHLKPPPEDWGSYLRAHDLKATFSVLWQGKEGATEPLLTAEQFARVRAYHAEWDMDPVYHDGHFLGWY